MPYINIFDGKNIKAIDFSPFGGIDGFLSASSGGNNADVVFLRKTVGWLNKALLMTGNAVSQLPYRITNKATGAEVDKLSAWGGVKSPQTVIYKVAVSLCGGAAYVLPEVISGGIVNLHYVAPQTVTPSIDANGKLTGFSRYAGGSQKKLDVEEVIYFWYPDDTVEVGAAQTTPLGNALLPASLIAAMDNSLRQYGEHGFIPPTILSAKGMTNPSDAEKTERWWNAFLRGWTKTVAKIINAETMSTTVVGAGMDEMRGSYIELTTQQIKAIAAAFGIPISVFISDENSYATLQGDTRNWYSSGVFVTIYQTIEDTLNAQLFSRFGLEFKFMPETLDVFKDSENEEIASVATLTALLASTPSEMLLAASIVGYQITEAQEKQIAALLNKPKPTQGVTITAPIAAVETLPTKTAGINANAEDDAIASEMTKWATFSKKWRKREFEVKFIPPALALKIRVGLRSAETANDVDAVFAAALDELPVIRLARAIEAAA